MARQWSVRGWYPLLDAQGQRFTGVGRYAADLHADGYGAREVPVTRTVRTRGYLSIDAGEAQRALAGVFAVLTQDDVPDVRYGPFVKDRTLFARDVVRYEGEIVAAVAALTPEIAQRRRRRDRGRVRAAAGRQRPRGRARRRRAAGPRGLGAYGASEDVVRDGNVARYPRSSRATPTRRMAEADIVVCERYVADMSHAVPIEPHAVVAQWQGDKVTVWSSTQVPVHRPQRASRDAPDARAQRPRRSCRYLGGGFGGKCELPLRGARRRAGARRQAAGAAGVLAAARSSSRPTTGARAVDRARDGRDAATARSSPAAARLVLDNGAYTADDAVLPAARRDDGRRPVQGRERVHRLEPGLHEPTPSGSVRAPTAPQACWAVEQHMDAVAGELGIDPGRVPAQDDRPHRRRGPDRPGVRADRRSRDAGPGGRADRLRPGPARRRGDRRRARLVAVVRGAVRRVPEAERRRLRDDHHRRPGVRHRRGDGAADAGRRGARAWSPRTSRSSTRTRTPAPYDAGARARRRRSTTAARWSPPRARCASSCSTSPRRSWRRRAPTSSWSTGRCASRARRPERVDPGAGREGPRRRAAARPGRRRRAGDARGRRVRLHRPARLGVVRSRRRSSPTRCAARSTATRASSACWRSRRRTTAAGSSTRSARTARSRAGS